jgi:hypothetical protein
VGQGIHEGRFVMQLSLFEEDKVEVPPTNVRQKKCSGCDATFPETDEHFYKGYAYYSKDGSKLQHYLNKCIPCHIKGTQAQYALKKKHGYKAYGTCDCCGVDAKDVKGGKLHLDHCHVTGEYRGHLCGSCNRGLGMLGDNLTGVQLALDYLKRVESKG